MMELINVDAIHSQSFEAAFHRLTQMRRSRVMRPLTWAGTIPAALGRDHKSLRIGKKRFGNEFLIHVRTIRVRSVDEVHVQLCAAAQNGEGSLLIFRRAPNAFTSETHCAVAKTINGKLASQRNC